MTTETVPLHDHHFHPMGYVGMVTGLNLWDASDIPQVLDLVADRASRHQGPIIGQRLNDESLVEGRLPNRADIDDVVGDRPVLLYRYCGHVGVVNSKALQLAGIDSRTADPDGGKIDRDPAGAPTGVLRETALDLVAAPLEATVVPPDDETVIQALGALRGLGLGSMTAMAARDDPVWCGVGDEVATLGRLSEQLPLDIGVHVITERVEDLVVASRELGDAGGRVGFSGWKTFADGSLGGHTAALTFDYPEQPGNRGTLRLRPERFFPLARTTLELGGDVAVHAIGDRAINAVLDGFDVLVREGANPQRLRVEHASVMAGQQVERMARLGVVASVQPAFLASESGWLWKRLGEDRMMMAYPFRDLIEAGVTVIGGSDCPVEPPDPSIGINAAVDRHGINATQALTRSQARHLFQPPSAG